MARPKTSKKAVPTGACADLLNRCISVSEFLSTGSRLSAAFRNGLTNRKFKFFLSFCSLLRSPRKWLRNREGCKFFSHCGDTINYAQGGLQECGIFKTGFWFRI